MIDIVFDVAFFVAGVALAAFVLWWQPKWDPVNVTRNNFTLRVPSVVLLVLFGFAIASIGAWFRYQRFIEARTDLSNQARIAEADRDREKFKADMAEQIADVMRSRAFELVVELSMPENVSRKLSSPDKRIRDQVTLQGLVRKPADPIPKIREVSVGEISHNIVSVRIGDLTAGDRVNFAVQDGADRWVSEIFAVPTTPRLEMRKEQ
jgi:hypothetical protein